MIKIKSIELRNFLKHKHFKKEFGDGMVTMLTGENGCGKTSIMSAISFAFRGVVPSVDKKTPQGRVVHRPAKSASVIMEFTVDGRPAKITRTVTASGKGGRTLEWDGREITSDAEVDKTMTELLGADLKSVENLVFIPQGALDGLFSGTFTERTDMWARLTSIYGYDKIAGIVDQAAKRLAGGITDYTVTLQMAKDTAAQKEEVLAAAVEAMNQLPDYDVISASVLQLNRLSGTLAAIENAKADRDVFLSALGNAQKQACMSDNEIASHRADIDAAVARQSSVTAEKSKAVEAVAALKAAEDKLSAASFKKSAADRKIQAEAEVAAVEDSKPGDSGIVYTQAELSRVSDLMKQKADLTSSVSARSLMLPMLSKIADDAEAAAATLEKDFADTSADLSVRLKDVQETRNLLQLLKDNTDTCCPACGQTVGAGVGEYLDRQLAARTASLEEVRKLHGEREAAFAAAMDVAKSKRKTAADETANVNSVKRMLENVEAALKNLPSEAEAAELIKILNSHAAKAAEWEERRRSASAELAKANVMLAQFSGVPDEAEAANDLAVAKANLAAIDQRDFDAELRSIESEVLRLREVVAEANRATAVLSLNKTNYEAACSKLAAEEKNLKDLADNATDDVKISIAIRGVMTAESLNAAAVEMTQMLDRCREARVVAEAAERVLATSRDTIAEVERKIEAQRKKNDLLDDLKLLSAAFANGGASKDYLDYEFARAAVRVQDYLAETGAAFTVAPSEDSPLEFDFMILGDPDASWLPQSQLSGGQRVTLALGIIHACHQLFIPSVGLMCLDEPSLHLSTSAKEQLAEWVRSVEQTGDIQLIVCDHAPEVVAAAGDIVEFT